MVSSIAGHTAGAQPERLLIEGTSRLSTEQVRRMAGPVPIEPKARRSWAVNLTRRVAEAYQRRGYSYARAWSRVEPDGRVRLEVDEGRMQIAFVGASTLRSVLYRVDLHLPGNIFHLPTLKRTLDELKREHQLVGVYYRVTTEQPLVPNGLGMPVPQRLLRIYTLTRESFGWRLSVTLSSVWGIVPKGSFRFRDVILNDDRIESSISIAVPFRQLVFEEDPHFRWVHGNVRFGYRLPPVLSRTLAPMIDVGSQLSRYSRTDRAIESYLSYQGEMFFKAVLLLSRAFTFDIGQGISYTRVFDMTPDDAVENQDLLRYVTRFEPTMSFDRQLKRRNQRSYLHLRLDLGLSHERPSNNSSRLLIASDLTSQVVWNLGQSALIARGRGTLLLGDVRLWDEVPLAGSYLRTFFDNRYWVHQAIQATVAYQWALTDMFKVGAFHDLAVFSDRMRADHPIAIANSLGPSVHFLLFDLFALDVYYGFGFDRMGFDHNMSFSLQSAF